MKKKRLFLISTILIVILILISFLLYMSKSNEKYLYIVDDYPTMIVLDKARFKEFKNIMEEYQTTDKLIFLKKYSEILEKSIDRDWVIKNSKIIRRRYELIGLGSFQEEENFYYNVFKNNLEWSKFVISRGKFNEEDEPKLDEFLEYILFYSCTAIEPNTWYFKPEFNYSRIFNKNYLPNSYDYLLRQDFIDEGGELEYFNLYGGKIVDIKEIIKNGSLNSFEYNYKKEFYRYNLKFINSILREMDFNLNKSILKDNIEENKIMKDDYNELKNILLKAEKEEFYIIIYL